jgi:hypothetical protein
MLTGVFDGQSDTKAAAGSLERVNAEYAAAVAAVLTEFNRNGSRSHAFTNPSLTNLSTSRHAWLRAGSAQEVKRSKAESKAANVR